MLYDTQYDSVAILIQYLIVWIVWHNFQFWQGYLIYGYQRTTIVWQSWQHCPVTITCSYVGILHNNLEKYRNENISKCMDYKLFLRQLYLTFSFAKYYKQQQFWKKCLKFGMIFQPQSLCNINLFPRLACCSMLLITGCVDFCIIIYKFFCWICVSLYYVKKCLICKYSAQKKIWPI